MEKGDPAALEIIWTAYTSELLSFAQGMLRSRTDAEDALHELFMRIARSRHAVAKAARLRPYLFMMMRNIALDILKRREKFEPLPEEGQGGGGDVLASREPLANSERRELEEALKSLPEEQRTLVLLRAYEGMQFNEIAEALSISQGTASSRYRYGLEKLRRLLEE